MTRERTKERRSGSISKVSAFFAMEMLICLMAGYIAWTLFDPKLGVMVGAIMAFDPAMRYISKLNNIKILRLGK